MYCPTCGTLNVNSAIKCFRCGEILPQSVSQSALMREIPNYLIQAILVTVFCCLPFGIVAIVFAAQVNGKIQAGDIQGAIYASENAKKWTKISFCLGGAVLVLQGILVAIFS